MKYLKKLDLLLKERKRLNESIKSLQIANNKVMLKHLLSQIKVIEKLGGTSNLSIYQKELEDLMKNDKIDTYNSDRGNQKHDEFVKLLNENNILVSVDYKGYTGDEYSYGCTEYTVSLVKKEKKK